MALALALLAPSPMAQCEKPPPDPTRLDPQLREALEAVRAAEAAAKPQAEGAEPELRGLILNGADALAIVRVGDRYFAAKPGDSFTCQGRKATVRSIGRGAVILRSDNGAEVVLR